MPVATTISIAHRQREVTITTTWRTVWDCLNENDKLMIEKMASYEEDNEFEGGAIPTDGCIRSLNGVFQTRDTGDAGSAPRNIAIGEEYVCPIYNWLKHIEIRSTTTTFTGTLRIFFSKT